MSNCSRNDETNQTRDTFSTPPPPQSWVEPSPNWLEAIKEWKWLWEAHIYGFGIVFALIAFFAIIYLVVCYKFIFTKHRMHIAVMNLALIAAGSLRSLILFWDPYASSVNTSNGQLLACIISWGISSACITSSFSIVLLIFLETTKTSIGPARLKNLPFLISVTLVNILFLLVSDVLVWFHPETKWMVFICHFTFAVWGLVVSIGYLVAGFRMWRNLRSSLGETFYNRALDRDLLKLKRLFLLMCAASCFGMIKFSLSLYTAVGEYGVFADIGFVKSWPWFVVQSLLRILESFMCIFIFLIAFKSGKNNARATRTSPDTNQQTEIARARHSVTLNTQWIPKWSVLQIPEPQTWVTLKLVVPLICKTVFSAYKK